MIQSDPSAPFARSVIVGRIPALLFVIFTVFVITRDAGQIDALFDTLTFPRDQSTLVAASILVSTALALLTERPRGWLRATDLALFLAPVVCMILAFYDGTGSRAVFGFAALFVALAVGLLATSRSFSGWKSTLATAALAALVWLGLHVAILNQPVAFPRAIGTLAIAFSFVGLCLIWLRIALRQVLVSLIVLASLGYAFFSYQETHVIKPYGESADDGFQTNVRTSVSLHQTFRTWLKSRNDLQAYADAGKPYPVFVVASEGGGGYAAAHANLFLTKLQQRCPNFAQHLFAIVGVSGGSIGNTLFQASLPETTNFESYKGCGGKPQVDATLDALSQDHLSPVVAALLFQDFPNKLLFGALGRYDRAEALAASLSASAWGDKADVERFYWNHFWRADVAQPAFAMGEGPSLIFVATNAVSGKRYVFAPFSFPFNDYRARFEEYLRDMNWTGDDEMGARQADIRLIDGAVASASFPWVTPSRVLSGRLQESISLVDGGYLENSGAETARDIVDVFMARESDPNIGDLENVQPPKSYKGNARLDACQSITLTYVPPDGSLAAASDPTLPPATPDACSITFAVHVITIRAEVPYERKATRQNFFLDPLTALLSARSRRAETARFGLLSQMCGGLECPEADQLSTWRFYESVIATDYLTLPLGWYLPASRLRALEAFVAPEPGPEFDYDDQPEGGWPEIFDQQSRPFGSMRDNPVKMGAIERALDPAN